MLLKFEMFSLTAFDLTINPLPLQRLFKGAQSFFLAQITSRIAKFRSVISIFAYGSFFDNKPTSELTGVSLIVVMDKDVGRADALPADIALTYQRTRRMFPLPGHRFEPTIEFIFLSEMKDGFAPPMSVAMRSKLGRLKLLYGRLIELAGARTSITKSEVLARFDSLLRMPLVAARRDLGRLVFWKRIFLEAADLLCLLDLADLADDLRNHSHLNFLSRCDFKLISEAAAPEVFFSILLEFEQRACDALHAREPVIRIELREDVQNRGYWNDAQYLWPDGLDQLEPGERPRLTAIPSVPIGLCPSLMHFAIDEQIPMLQFDRGAFAAVRSVREALAGSPSLNQRLLVSAQGRLFIIVSENDSTDVIPLNPAVFANWYAAAEGHPATYEMIRSLYEEQMALAKETFTALANSYRKDDGHLVKPDYPCIYQEDDARLMEAALRLLRVQAASVGRTLIRQSSELFKYLRAQHPECDEFIDELQRYWTKVKTNPAALPEANNLHRCLHQFMWQYLAEVPRITLDHINGYLGITVGVITRNRASDLLEMLISLTHQARPPDEVLIVDNGSTDDTQMTIDSFRGSLPLRSLFLAEPDVPGARNLVLEEAVNEIVSFIDDDCISEPEWLASVERAFLRAENIGIVGGYVAHHPAPRRSVLDDYYQNFHHGRT
jgi:hypothetical protein